MPEDHSLWVVQCTTSSEAVESFVHVFEENAATVSWSQDNVTKKWRIEAIFLGKPARAMLQEKLEEQASRFYQPVPLLTCELLPARDWLAENFLSFPPLTVGRFYIYGSHHPAEVPPGLIGLHLDAATAFGSGSHETTRGCLEALQDLADYYMWQNPLDIGCGSGILALAMAFLNPNVPVLACDCDPEAVRVAQQNSLINGQEKHIESIESNGFEASRLHEKKPYDVIVANILADPLKMIAPQIAEFSDGWVILSGILASQSPELIALYMSQGFACVEEKVLGEWSTLILKKNGRSDGI